MMDNEERDRHPGGPAGRGRGQDSPPGRRRPRPSTSAGTKSSTTSSTSRSSRPSTSTSTTTPAKPTRPRGRPHGRALVRAAVARSSAHDLSGRQAIVLYASHPEFEQTNVIEGEIDEGTGGVTEGLQRRIVLPIAAQRWQIPITCSATSSCTRSSTTSRPATPASMPLWFIEGMAEYLSLGPRDPQTAMWLRDAAIEDRLPDDPGSRQPEVLPVPLRARVLGVRRRPLGRRGDRPDHGGVISPTGRRADSVHAPIRGADDEGPRAVSTLADACSRS